MPFPKPTTLTDMIELNMYELKLKDLAQLLGIEASRVSVLLNGKRKLSINLTWPGDFMRSWVLTGILFWNPINKRRKPGYEPGFLPFTRLFPSGKRYGFGLEFVPILYQIGYEARPASLVAGP